MGEAVDSGHLAPQLCSGSLAAATPRQPGIAVPDSPTAVSSHFLSLPLTSHSFLLPTPAQPPPDKHGPDHRAAGPGLWGRQGAPVLPMLPQSDL